VILVDTSVWIDYLRATETPATAILDGLMADSVPFAITGIVYQEILQGADSTESYERLAEYFGTQRFLHPQDPAETHAGAAKLYVRCRCAGVTIRSTIDCLIAQIAIEHQASLLHNDRDFDYLATTTPELQFVIRDW